MKSSTRADAEQPTALKHEFARALRNNATHAERKLWHCLRDKRLNGFKFRRQQPIGPFVADFYCAGAKLIIELDGSQHADGEHPGYDMRRTEWLQARGYRVLRLWNSDVLSDSDYGLGCILHEIEKTLGREAE